MPRVAAKDRDALVESRRQQILDATVHLLAKKSFSSTSVEEIARAAGLSKGTVYLYFPNKQALLDEVVQRYSLLPDLEALASQFEQVPTEDVVKAAVPLLWQRLRARKEIVALLLREGPVKIENARLFIERVVLPGNRIIARWLETRVGPERARQIDTLVAGRSMLGMLLVFFVTQELLGGREVHPIADETITSTIAEVFLHGVLGSDKPTGDLPC